MTTKLKFMLTALMLVFIVFMAGCNSDGDAADNDGASTDSDEQIMIKFAHESPETSTIHDGIVNFTERVTELTDGQVEFEIFPASQMGDSSDYLSLTNNLVVDMAYHYPSYTPSEMPYLANISGLPGLYTSNEAGTKAYWDLVNDERVLESDFLSNGVRPIAPVAGNSFELFTKGEEIKSPSDLEGMQIRSSGGVVSELMEHFNANPIQMPIGDAYTALDQGVIEAVNTGFEGTRIAGITDLVKFATKGVAFGANMAVYSINEELFQSFPEDIQEAFLQAGQEGALFAAEALREGEVEIENNFSEDDDVTIIEPTGSVKEEWDAAYLEFVEGQLDEDHLEIYQLFQELVGKYSE